MYDTFERGVDILEIFTEHGEIARRDSERYYPERIGTVGGSRTRPRGVIDQHGRTYRSINAAAKANGISDTSIARMLKGEVKKTKGLVFRYLDGDSVHGE